MATIAWCRSPLSSISTPEPGSEATRARPPGCSNNSRSDRPLLYFSSSVTCGEPIPAFKLRDSIWSNHEPDVAETDRIAVVLEVEAALFRVVLELGVVVDLDPVVDDRDPGLPDELAVFLLDPNLDV